MWKDVSISLRTCLATLSVCAVGYPAVVFGFAQIAVPGRADGSLIRDDKGRVVGSQLIAQRFQRPEYLWPRPSAVDYDAAATGGSNLSPTNPVLKERIGKDVLRFAATSSDPVPAELVMASGSGVDPHVTLDGALYQAPRIARVRRVSLPSVEGVLRSCSESSLGSPALVNVLQANIALDRALGSVSR